MLHVILGLSLVGQGDRPIDARAVAEVFRNHAASFKDVQFLYEGAIRRVHEGKEEEIRAFQGSYAYREDGATLIDVFDRPKDRAGSRTLYAMLRDEKEVLDATPDLSVRQGSREPERANGGPGALNRSDAPERIFPAYFLRTHADPAEYDLETHGWEDVGGHRCLVVSALISQKRYVKTPKLAGSYLKLWLDLERGGNPLRVESYANGHLIVRTEVDVVVPIPRGQDPPLWMPATGRTMSYGVKLDRGKVLYATEPDHVETHAILIDTLKFDRGLADGFFSTKKHVSVTSDEKLVKLQRDLDRAAVEKKKEEARERANRPRMDPESIQRRLDEALVEADKQSARLEASSAARAGHPWWGTLAWLVPPVALLLAVTIRRRTGGRG